MTYSTFNVSYLCNYTMKQTRDLNKQLFEIAEPQQGVFTAKQAEDAGFLQTNHAYHAKRGDWIREERGIFRLALFPHSPEQQKVIYSLWSSNREGEIQGIYSHETALSYYELSDVNPSKLHITVPISFRRTRETPGILRLHRANLSKSEIQASRGFFVTSPLRTLRDVIESKSISFEWIQQAVSQSLERGLVQRSDLKKIIMERKKTAEPRFASELDYLLKMVNS